jgi:hypothetical protein
MVLGLLLAGKYYIGNRICSLTAGRPKPNWQWLVSHWLRAAHLTLLVQKASTLIR